jgi:hypothetical protein
MNDPRPLHRLFGLTWMDFFDGTDIAVEMELDLSLKQQFLDLVLIRKGRGPIPRRMPDGFEELAAHNLITFKSHHEALDAWALWELIGHFVNYRKQASPTLQDLLPENDFRLFAVCARFPQRLTERAELQVVREGVYEVQVFGLRIRIVVLGQLPEEEQNAMLHLFSAQEDLLRYSHAHYRPHSADTSSVLLQMCELYVEDQTMSERLKELCRQELEDFLRRMPPERLAKVLPAEERVKGLAAEERLKGLSADEVLKALPPEVAEEILRKIKANGASSNPK